MRWRTGNQCSSSSSGWEGDCRGTCRTIRDAVFWTRCSFWMLLDLVYKIIKHYSHPTEGIKEFSSNGSQVTYLIIRGLNLQPNLLSFASDQNENYSKRCNPSHSTVSPNEWNMDIWNSFEGNKLCVIYPNMAEFHTIKNIPLRCSGRYQTTNRSYWPNTFAFYYSRGSTNMPILLPSLAVKHMLVYSPNFRHYPTWILHGLFY